MTISKTKYRRHKPSRTPQLLVIGGVGLLVIMILVFKQIRNTFNNPEVGVGELPVMQLDSALRAGQPTLTFFHSNKCQQCIVMMETVAQVYPEFSQTNELVDINVYDENNAVLLNRVGLRYIPTLIFYDHTGRGAGFSWGNGRRPAASNSGGTG